MTPVEGTDDFRRAAQALNEAADRDLRKQVYEGFRKAAKPLGVKVITEGSAELPKRGGLAMRVAQARMSQSNATTGRNPGIALRFKVREGWYLGRIDEGAIKHPVFNRRGPDGRRIMRERQIRPGAFTRPFEAGAPQVRQEVINQLNQVLEEVARKSSGGHL